MQRCSKVAGRVALRAVLDTVLLHARLRLGWIPESVRVRILHCSVFEIIYENVPYSPAMQRTSPPDIRDCALHARASQIPHPHYRVAPSAPAATSPGLIAGVAAIQAAVICSYYNDVSLCCFAGHRFLFCFQPSVN